MTIFAAGAAVAATSANAAPAPETLFAPAELTGKAKSGGRFSGKVVLITGATAGIGKTTAECFAREGANVMFCGRRETFGRAVEAAIRENGGEATYMHADVRDDAQVNALIDACVNKYGRLDIAFNNAGYFMDPNGDPELVPGPIDKMSLKHWTMIMETNAGGVFHAMRHEIPVMVEQKAGCIVNMASVSGHVSFAGMGGYAASKHAIIGLTKVAAIELADKNVRVNSISPLAVATPMIDQSLAYFKITPEQAAAGAPNKRINTTDEMARAVMFLASDDASSMTGMDLDVTGGWLAR